MAYAFNEYTGTTDTDYLISFAGVAPGYLSQDHVKFYLNGVLQPDSSRTFIDATHVRITAPLTTDIVRFQRITSPETPLVDWIGGAGVSEYNLDLNTLQMLYLAQESADKGEIDLSTALGYTVLAGNSADLAEEWATNPEDDEVTGYPGYYSALHHSAKSAASASAASTSESNAATSEANAATSESNADTSEANALASELKAEKWADETEDVEVETGKYSAKHWASKASALTPYYVVADLETDISAIGSTPTTVAIKDAQTLTGHLTIPSNITLEIAQGGSIDGAYTLTVDGNINAGYYQIFGSSITVTGLTKVYPEWWGADYTTDSAVEFNKAATSLTGGGTLDLIGRYFRVDSTVTLKSKTKVIGDLSHYIDFSNAVDTDTLFESSGTFTTVASLSVNATKGDLTVTAPGHGLASGDIVHIRSELIWTGSVKDAEFCVVESVLNDTVTFTNKLIRSYSVANSATLVKLIPTENITFEGVWAKGSTTNNHFGIHLIGATNASVRNCKFEYMKRRAVRFLRTFGAAVYNLEVSHSNENGLGYGVAIASCQNVTVYKSRFFNCRHGVTLGGESYGPSRFIIVDACLVDGALDAGLDSHAPSEFVTWSHNTVRNSGTGSEQDGIMHQGSTATIIGNTLIECSRHGIILQTQVNLAADETFIICNNTTRNVASTGISVSNAGGLLRNLSITGNTCLYSGDRGIVVSASSLIEDINVSNNTVYRSSVVDIWIFGDLADIKGGVISNNTIDHGVTTDSCIYLQGRTGTAVVENIVVCNNFLRYGSVALRGVNTNFLTVIGNVSAGATTPYNYTGASCVPLLADVLTLNVDR